MGHQWALRFSRFWAVSLLALLFSTMRLWWPFNTPAIATYPAVPSVELLTLPAWCDALFVPLFASAVIVFFSRLGPPRSKISIGWAIIGFAIAVGIADDQHRMQPWVLQTGFYSIILACLPSNEALRPIRAIAISIYAYSAAGKLDYQFIHTVGQDFLGSAVGVVGLEITQWPESIRTAGAFAFPVSELIVAGLLAWPRTRRIGGVFAMLLHASLIVLLSPWVMGHSLGVLIWNGVLIGQSWFLFLTPMEPALSPLSTSKRAVQPSDAGWRRAIAITTSCVAVSMPLAERSGYWDHWASWALYSPHSSRFELYLPKSQLSRWPESIRDAALPDQDGDSWQEISLSSWSLAARGVPVVPQARYQLQLAAQIAEDMSSDLAMRGRLKSVADRWTGKRDDESLFDRQAITESAQTYWIGRRRPTKNRELTD